ncbi:MAG TPA: hypothetical protein VLA34_01385, partial [Candidatus Krumholzibacterium sp.]|nr:hypothetical protein [Candidatus Krumholzibacterium sp.]
GLMADGSITAWGGNAFGECDVPEPNSDFIQIAASQRYSLGRKSDGSLFVWGYDPEGLQDVPEPNTGFLTADPSVKHVVAIRDDQTTAVAFSAIIAEASGESITLRWETVANEPLEGFHVYRATVPGEFMRVTDYPLCPDVRIYEDRAVEYGRQYRYSVTALTAGGREIRSLETEAYLEVPSMILHQNVPNPFNPSTRIAFMLPGGRRIVRLIDKVLPAGRNEVDWDGRDDGGHPVASGTYFYRLAAGRKVETRKMVLLR